MMLAFLLFAGLNFAFAQTKTISGTVTSADDGQALPGVTVRVKGTTIGTITDFNGKYSIDVSNNASTLVFSFVGMKTQEIAIAGKTTINVVMKTGAVSINEVVVTALGIKRSEKTIGYAATSVEGATLEKEQPVNVLSSLAGKVAGMQVQSTSSDPGAASTVTIRGFSSINGSNEPLYVVDGVPLQQSTINTQLHAISAGGISNIAASDVASMTILKGAAATALYGSRAANGVILITTKQGSKEGGKNFSITYNGGLQATQLSVFPTLQNEWGQGWNGNQTYIENGSWGPKLNGTLQNYGPIWNNQQLLRYYTAKKNNIKDFFDIGISMNHDISLSGESANSKMKYYVSYSNSNNDGIMPTDADSYKRNTIAYRSSYHGADWFTISSTMNFANSKTNTVGSNQGTSVIDGLYEFPRDISVVDLQNLPGAFNSPQAYFTPYGITSPYWAIANNYNQLNSKQVFGKLQVDINPIKALTLTYRFGFSYTDYDRKVGVPQISVTDDNIQEDYGYSPTNMNQSGSVYAAYARNYEINHDFLANYDKKFGAISFTALAGLNINERYWTSMAGQTDVLTFNTGFWDLSNGATKTTIAEGQTKRRLVGLFGEVTLGFKDMLFLDVSARNDLSSTLPTGSNSYFYPGATLSWIFTNVLPKNDILSFGKLRFAYGKTGNDAAPYQTSARYVQAYANGYYGGGIASFPMNGVNSFISSLTAGSATLRPEMTTEAEGGFNLKFFMGRIGLDASYYSRKTTDQIFTLPIDPATGYSSLVTNFGTVQNKGIELVLTTTPVKKSHFRWDFNVNFALNRNKVLTMPSSLEGGKVIIGRFSAGNDAVNMYAEAGKPMGVYYTYLPQRVTDKNSQYYGDLIVDANGQPVLTDQLQSTGLDMNHKWTGGITTSLSAYGFTLSAALDVRYGGTMFSRTKNLMEFTGNGIITTYNDRRPFTVPNSVQVTGTDANGNPTDYAENTTALKLYDGSYQKYYDSYGYGNGGEAFLVDRSYAKLRNISLSYSLPKKWAKALYLSNLTVSAYINNAFVWTAKDNYYIDPETSSYGTDLGGQFGELYSNPASRIYGFNIRITY